MNPVAFADSCPAFVRLSGIDNDLFRTATAPSKDDGYIRLYINGTQIASQVNYDNDTLYIDRLYFGAQGLDSGSIDSFYLDEVQAFRYTVIDGSVPVDLDKITPPDMAENSLEKVYHYDKPQPHAVLSVEREQPALKPRIKLATLTAGEPSAHGSDHPQDPVQIAIRR
jgi:hypothetical protein